MNKENTDRSHVQNVIPEVHASEKNEKPKNKLSFTTDNAKDISGDLKGNIPVDGLCSQSHKSRSKRSI